MPLSPYQQLQEEFAKAQALEAAAHYLRFDAEMQMPTGVASDRGEQLAAIELERHALLVAPKIARLIDRAEANRPQLDPLDEDNLNHMRRLKDRALALPKSLVARRAKASARALAARRAVMLGEDPQALWSALAEMLALTQDRAALLAKNSGVSPEDCLLDEIHPGLKRADVDPLLKALTAQMPEWVQTYKNFKPVESAPVSVDQQQAAISALLSRLPVLPERIQLVQNRVTQILSKVPGDYRISLALNERDPWLGLRLVLGHLTEALHHQFLPPSLQRQPVSTQRSPLLRTAERYFWGQRFAREPSCWVGFKDDSTTALFWSQQPLDQMARELNSSGAGASSLWSTTEWGYFAKACVFLELDQKLFDGDLAVRDLDEAYRDAGRRLPAVMADDRFGVVSESFWMNGESFRPLQWVAGAAIGLQVWELIKAEHEDLLAESQAGDMLAVWRWWREHFNTHLTAKTLDEELESLTGRTLSAQPIFRHFDHLEAGVVG